MNILWLWVIAGIVLAVIGVKTVFELTDDDWWDDMLDVLRRIT